MVVQAAAHSTANAVLTVGDARETVEVIAPEISIETEQPLLGTTIQRRLLEDLPQLSVGTVRQIDRRNGLFTVDMNNYSTLTVTLPSNVSTNDVNRFNSLRTGDFVRFYGTYINSSQVQLRQFY